MKQLIVALALLGLVGCGPGKRDRAKSQVETIVRKEFNKENFPDGGKTGQRDPWGHEITWEVTKGVVFYNLEVRSNGPDGLPYTSDDIIASASYSDWSAERGAEALGRGLSRGAVQGVKQGIKGNGEKKK